MERTGKIRDLLIIIAIAACVLLWNLGTGSLTSWDEAVYAQVSREMLNSHNYVDLTWGGGPWSDKPPLYMWVTVLFYKTFGINEFSARLFSALCGIGTVIVTYLLSYALYSSRRAAFAAALILLSTWHFIWSGKVGMLDSPLTFFVLLSIYFFRLGERKKIFIFFSMLSFTCAFLTKGGGALLIPIIIAAYLVCSKKLYLLKEPYFFTGLAVSVLVLGAWHLSAFAHYGKGFVNGYFMKHLFVRTTQAVDNHTGNIFTYFRVLPNKGRPWSILSFFVVPFAVWRFFVKKEDAHILPVIWVAVVLLIFSLVKTKLNWYIVPLYPATSILIGWFCALIFGKYTVFIISMGAVSSLIYLVTVCNIFNLNYTPNTKALALMAGERVPRNETIFLCDGDPSARFYFAGVGNGAKEGADSEELLTKRNCYILLSKKTLSEKHRSDFAVIAESPDLVVIKSGK